MSGEPVVIVGAGHAGVQVALALRAEGYRGRVILVDAEAEMPYHRPPLSKAYLLGKLPAEGLLFRPPEHYGRDGIELCLGRPVAAIERSARRVRFADGEALAYGHLVLATGARNRALALPGLDLDGVVTLRTRRDADALSRRLVTARTVVALGGGFIGLEFAAVAAARGLAVAVIEREHQLLARAVSARIADDVLAAHRAAGMQIRLGCEVERVVGRDGAVAAVLTRDGDGIPADLVLVGVGAVAEDGLAAAAGLTVDGGIVVDDHLATEDAAISAVGDCVRFPHPLLGGIRLESVQNAIDQAKAVAARLAGRPAAYGAVPWFWSDQGPLKLQIAGVALPSDESVALAGGAPGRTVLRFRAGRMVAVETLNRPAEHIAARRLLADGRGPAPDEAAAPGFTLKAWAAR